MPGTSLWQVLYVNCADDKTEVQSGQVTAQDRTAIKWKSQDLNPDNLVIEFMSLTTLSKSVNFPEAIFLVNPPGELPRSH